MAGTPTGGAGGSSSDAPRILTLGTNTMMLTPEQTLIISVVATDPNGIDDVIGGVVIDPQGTGSYGALQSAAAEGSYTLSLAWDAINTVRGIDAPPEGASRTFRVQIFDTAGNMTSGDVSVTLLCGDEDPACGGDCVNLATNGNHCGRCHHACPAEADGCLEGSCMGYVVDTDALTCTEVCASAQTTCVGPAEPGEPIGYTSGCTALEVALETCAERAPDQACEVECACAFP
jgi:hypothetical protein